MNTVVQAPGPIYLGPDEQLRLPDVDEVLDLGHAIYTADHPHASPYNRKISREQINRFLRTKVRPGTAEQAYLNAMLGVARGYARELERARQEWMRDVQHAKDKHARRERQIRGDSLTKHGLKAVWKFAGHIVIGLAGAAIALVIGGSLPQLAERTGTTLPSILVGMFSVLVGRYVGSWYLNYRMNRAFTAYATEDFFANKMYAKKKADAIKFWRVRGCEEWQQYTGKPYPQKASYLMVMEADENTRDQMRELDIRHNTTDIQRLIAALKSATQALVEKRRARKRANA